MIVEGVEEHMVHDRSIHSTTRPFSVCVDDETLRGNILTSLPLRLTMVPQNSYTRPL